METVSLSEQPELASKSGEIDIAVIRSQPLVLRRTTIDVLDPERVNEGHATPTANLPIPFPCCVWTQKQNQQQPSLARIITHLPNVKPGNSLDQILFPPSS